MFGFHQTGAHTGHLLLIELHIRPVVLQQAGGTKDIGRSNKYMQSVARLFLLSGAAASSTSCRAGERLTSETHAERCLDGGEFTIGSNHHYLEVREERQVEVRPFCIDTFEVTNARFAEFVEQTGYRTLAERGPSHADYPDAPDEFFQAASAVFQAPKRIDDGMMPMSW